MLFLFVAFIPSVSAQQNVQIRGKITDATTGEEIIGANIIQEGTTNGTITGIDGSFTLNATANSTLRFSSIGYITQTMAVPPGPNAQLNIRLIEDTQLLDEVVVVGYGTQKKSEITASVSSLSEENFNVTAAATSALELAQGRIPGLIIQTSGDPRQAVNIGIRGNSSMRGSNQPLTVIDGVPGGDLSLIPPEDITNISVLKDASAAAIYGTRGANGVILITTKRGGSTPGELRSTFEYSGTLSHSYIYKQPRMLTGEEYRNYMQAGGYNSTMLHDYGDNTNWQDLLTNNNNVSQTHNLSIRGGTQKSNYRASVFLRQFDPIMIESNQQNWGTRATINHLGLNDRLDIQFNLNASFMERNMVGRQDEWEQAAQRNPTEPAKDENGKWLEDAAFNSSNPLARYSTMEDTRNRVTLLLASTATLTIMEGLKARLLTSWAQYNDTRNQYYQLESKTSVDSYGGGGYARKWSDKDVKQVMEFTVDYSKIFNDIHSVNVIAGHSYEYQVREQFDAWNTGFLSDSYKYNNLGLGTGNALAGTSRSNISSDKRDNKLASFFGRINYGLLDKYLVSVTLRYDGSSRFGANYRWGTFPAVSAGWVLSKEEFMKNITFLNNLKLRFGYGITGNMPDDSDVGISGNYLYMTTLGTRTSGHLYPIGNTWYSTLGPARNPNPNLKWEEKREFNFGIDFTVYKNRLSGTIDIYKRNTVDIINDYTAQMPPYVLSTIYTNVGTMSNRGVEIGLNYKAINNRDFKWEIAGTFVFQKNILESFSNDVYKASYREWQGLPSPGALGNVFRTEEGQATGGFYAKRFAGFDDNGKWLFYNRNNDVVPLSEMVPADLTIVGNGTPKFHASLNNTFRYKQFDMTIFLRGKFGYQILNTKEMYFGNRNWFPNNVLKTATTKHNQLQDAPQYCDYYLESGSFVKIDNMSFGYNFPLKSRKWLSNARIYATWQNAATFTKYSGTTPDLRDSGFTPGYDARGFVPAISTLLFGVNLGF